MCEDYDELIRSTTIHYEDTSFSHEHGVEKQGYYWGDINLLEHDIRPYIGAEHCFEVDTGREEKEVPMRLTEELIWEMI